MESLRKTVKLETVDAYWQDGPNFFFKAKSISEDFVCKEMMEILAEQAKGSTLVFRHRHPEGNTEKIVPIFGRGFESKVVLEHGKNYLETVYKIETENKWGHPIPHQRKFADWVQSKYDDDDPVGISLNYILHRDVLDGSFKNYWINTVEHTGTSYPACEDCRNYTGEEAIQMTKEKAKGKFTGLSSEQLELQLEKMTLEKEDLEKELHKLESDKSALQKKVAEQESEVKKLQNTDQALKKQVLELASNLQAMREELDYANSVKPLIDEIIRLEGRPELEHFYREKAKETDKEGNATGIKYLQDYKAKLEQPKANVSKLNPIQKMVELRKKRLEIEPQAKEDILDNVDPSIRAQMKEFLENGGNR